MDSQAFQKQLDAKNGSGVLKLLAGKTFHTSAPVAVRCLLCGTKFRHQYWHLLRKRTSGCPTCHPRGTANKTTHEDYVARVREIHGSRICVVGRYEKAQIKIKHRCSSGHTFDSKPNYVLTGYGCRFCAWKENTEANRVPEEQFLAELRKKNPKVRLVGEYLQVTSKTSFECLVCGHLWKTTPNALRKGGCPSCFISNIGRHIYRKNPVQFGARTLHVQGFERFALDLLRERRVSPTWVQAGAAVPKIRYWFSRDKKFHWYTPDLWIPSRNALIEVKSTHTFGLFDTERHKLTFFKVRAKARAAIDQGYDFRLWLFDRDGSRIPVPENWTTLSHSQILRKVRT